MLLLSCTFHRAPWARVVTPVRLAAVVAVSFMAARLRGWRWAHSSWACSADSVCALAPIWLSMTLLPGLFTTTRGQFTLIAAGWFGAVPGCVATLVDVPIPGAVLTGISAATISIMLLLSRVLPLPEDEIGSPKEHPSKPVTGD